MICLCGHNDEASPPAGTGVPKNGSQHVLVGGITSCLYCASWACHPERFYPRWDEKARAYITTELADVFIDAYEEYEDSATEDDLFTTEKDGTHGPDPTI
jgi:hypothetical protein